MTMVVGKARNDVFRLCAPKPIRDVTLRTYKSGSKIFRKIAYNSAPYAYH